jgi:hypothetical protein
MGQELRYRVRRPRIKVKQPEGRSQVNSLEIPRWFDRVDSSSLQKNEKDRLLITDIEIGTVTRRLQESL